MSEVTIITIADAIFCAIEVIDKIIKRFDFLEDEMKSFDAKRGLAKTAGTAINVVGTGLAIGGAFFTGGASLLVAGILTSVAGTGANLITDFVDRAETKECIEEMQTLVSEYAEESEKIRKLSESFAAQIEELMKKFNVDYKTAFFIALGGGMGRKGTESYAVAAVTMSSVSLLAKSLSTVSLTASEIQLLGNILGITFTTSKAGASGASAAAMGVKTAIQGIAKTAAVVGVAFTVFEVVSLVSDLLDDHVTVKKIQETRLKLKKEKKGLKTKQELLFDIKAKTEVVKLEEELRRATKVIRDDNDSDSSDDDDDDEVVLVKRYTVRKEDLKNGPRLHRVIPWIIKFIGAPGDHSGHLRARMLNGSGSDFSNFVPMNANLNQSGFIKREYLIRRTLRNNESSYAEVTIYLHYKLKSSYPLRPVKIRHTFRVLNENKLLIFSGDEMFQNKVAHDARYDAEEDSSAFDNVIED